MTDHVFYLWACPVDNLRWWTADNEDKRSHGCKNPDHVIVEMGWLSTRDAPKVVPA